MKKTLFFILVCCLVNTVALASSSISDKQNYLKKNYVSSATSNYDALDVYGILNFLMQYSEEDRKWNYELTDLTWDEITRAIDGEPEVIFNKLIGRFIWKEINGYKVLVKLYINQRKFNGVFNGEYFKNLEELYCQNNKLTNIDVSKNFNLQYINCSYNQLTILDVSKNSKLRILYCYYNQLTELNVSNTINLTKLDCENNALAELDLSKSKKLEYLHCINNQFTTLDLTHNINLEKLYCQNNKISQLDLSANTKLEYLNSSYNNLTELDVSKNIRLETLNCENNQLTSLNLSSNYNLIYLYCYNNQITSLDLSNVTHLKYLYCFSNKLKTIDVSKNIYLIDLYCYSNQLSTLDISKNTKLVYLYCYSNLIEALDVSKNVNLTSLYCYSNQLISLILPKMNKLSKLVGATNHLKFSTLQGNFISIKNLTLTPQATLDGGTKGYLEILDLSSEYLIDGKITTYNWYDKATNEEVNMYALNGKFYASPENAGKTLVCLMTNELFPDFLFEYEVTIKDEMISSRNVKTTIPEGFKLVGSQGKHKAIESVQLIPNPVIDILKINTTSKVESANVYSYTGKEVKRIPTVYNNELNLQDLPSGIYMISIKTEQGTVTQKVIKK